MVVDTYTHLQVTAFTFGKTRTRGLQEYTTQHYSLVGKVPDNVPLEGAATIPDNFVTAFYKMILRKKVTLADLESVDAELHRGLTWMLYVLAISLPLPIDADEVTLQ